MAPEEKLPAAAHITPSSLLAPTIQSWRIYLEDQAVSKHTVKAFLSDMNLFAGYFGEDKRLGDVTTTDIHHYLDWLEKGRGVPCSPKSLARRITSVKSFFRWLRQYGVILADPAEPVPQRTVISPLPQTLTAEEVEKLRMAGEARRRAARPDARHLTLFELLLATGVKKGELLALKTEHVVLEGENAPYLFVRYASAANRFKERKIELPEAWLALYDEYKAQFDLSERLFPWSQRRLEYLLEDLGKDAALEKHPSFDMCRWTCALNDLHAGMDRDSIRQKLGISKVQWREIGAKLDRLAAQEEEE
jgi:integrase/recombinase XerD